MTDEARSLRALEQRLDVIVEQSQRIAVLAAREQRALTDKEAAEVRRLQARRAAIESEWTRAHRAGAR